MKAILLATTALLLGSVGNAAQVHCVGTIFGYDLTADTSTNKGTVDSDIIVVVKSGSSILKQIDMKVTSQTIVPGSSFTITGNSPDGTGTFTGTYNASTDTYDGTMDAQTQLGPLQAALSCTATGPLLIEAGY